ncbi:MAG: desulfoferrodoxin family protein [Bacilli bacterium]|jgi:superoxide reductase
MAEKPKFYFCPHCHNLVEKVNDSGVPIICCGEEMIELTGNTVDAAHEKHVPEIAQEGNMVTVKVGSVDHPMIPAHYIQWIVLATTHGIQRRPLSPGEKPVATFALLPGESVVAAYEYCNLHGLWKKELA